MTGKEEMVLEAMKKAGKPVKSGDVANMTDFSKNEVTKIINALKKEGEISSPKRCFYAPVKK
jgi:biotin operon repressor